MYLRFLSLLFAVGCGIDDPGVGDGADPVACVCDPPDTAATTDTTDTADTAKTGDTGCTDPDTADTANPCADTGTTR